MIKCPNCGAELNFSVESQLVTCEHCRSTFDPQKLKEEIKKAGEHNYEGKSYSCSQCGATLMTFDETAITFCSYCGSQAMIESKLIKRNNPDFIIPFKKNKEECIEAYKKKISKYLFVPKYMKSDIVVNKFRGIYIPYCVYKVSFKGKSVSAGKICTGRSADYIYYDDYNLSADIDSEYNGLSYDLISDFYDKFSHSIPHDFKDAETFNPNYLAGFYADSFDVDKSLYEKNALALAKIDGTNRMLRIKEYRKYNCNNPNLSFGEIDKKIGMFPIYFLAIRDKSNKYVSYAVVNGQTGKVAVDLPIDFKKYILISLLLTIPIFFLINSLLVLTPTKVCIFSIIAAIISLIISIYQLNKIHERENHLDDIGYMGNSNNVKHKVLKKDSNTPFLFFLTILAGILVAFLIALPFANIKTQYIQPIAIFLLISYVVGGVIIRKKNSQELEIKVYNHEYKVPKKEKFKYSYKPVLSILIGLVALLLNFVDDIYYYGATLIMFSLIIWSFYDLIKGHNLLASTKLPQLEKRGGDENE